MKCACGHVFTSGYWPQEAVDLIGNTTFQCQSVATDMVTQRIISASMVEAVISESSMGTGSWLDVGFGNGSLLFTAIEYGFRGVGIEIRQPLVDDMTRIGVEAYCCSLERMPTCEQYEVISMADVLEHCPFPGTVLTNARARMRSNGTLFLSMPNMGSPIWDYLHSKNDLYWDEIEHYHNFSRERLYSFLKVCGFWPTKYRASRRYEACMEVIARAV